MRILIELDLCIKHGTGCSVAKMDLDSAFKHLTMLELSLQYLGIMIEKMFLLETCLSFGSAESCAIFEKFATALEWIIQQRTKEELSHYLDDFIFIHTLTAKGWEMQQIFYQTCKEIKSVPG